VRDNAHLGGDAWLLASEIEAREAKKDEEEMAKTDGKDGSKITTGEGQGEGQ